MSFARGAISLGLPEEMKVLGIVLTIELSAMMAVAGYFVDHDGVIRGRHYYPAATPAR